MKAPDPLFESAPTLHRSTPVDFGSGLERRETTKGGEDVTTPENAFKRMVTLTREGDSTTLADLMDAYTEAVERGRYPRDVLIRWVAEIFREARDAGSRNRPGSLDAAVARDRGEGRPRQVRDSYRLECKVQRRMEGGQPAAEARDAVLREETARIVADVACAIREGMARLRFVRRALANRGGYRRGGHRVRSLAKDARAGVRETDAQVAAMRAASGGEMVRAPTPDES